MHYFWSSGNMAYILVDAAADLLVDLVHFLARYAEQPPQPVQLTCILLCAGKKLD